MSTPSTGPRGGEPRSGPLAGLRVLDLTTSYAGPTASMYLADLGAEVVKVERPGVGDDARTWGPPFVDGASAWFASANRNKRSFALDIGSEEGRALLHRLIATADVFLQNVNPSKLGRLGIDPDELTQRHPRLIYCSISGFGFDGPARDQPGYDLAAQARSGLMSVTGARGGSPQRVSTALSDIVTGMCAALAISAAVVRQRGEGVGEVIDVSLLDSDLALMAPRIAAYLAGDPEPAPSGGTDSVLAVYQTFPTADRDIVVAIGNDSMWQRFSTCLGLTELAADDDLATNAGRREQRGRITAAIAAKLAEHRAEHWLAVLGERGVPCSLVQSLSEVVTDPQVVERESILPVPGGRTGLHSVHSPFRLRTIPGPRNERFPELGADTRALLEELGCSADEIERMSEAGVVGAPVTVDTKGAPAR
ncbi:CaiB/BaiF CoA transferase family protein [Microbacterium timonense]|uniref:CaiB/BaiF CoA transferase family protein n=1 Tax=Microbacterium timonense TaxID=2086576 RepID=UPI000D0E5458|nr:CoA transferase [Microbacterium timonense]